MNPEFPPLMFNEPRISRRRKEKPRHIGFPPDLLQRRAEIAQQLRGQVRPLAAKLKTLTPDQLRAVMVKLKHAHPLSKSDLVGTGLKPVSMPGDEVTLVVPRGASLDALDRKLVQFGGRLTKLGLPANRLGLLTAIPEASPTDRLAQPLLKNYQRLVRKKWLIYEIEITSLAEDSNSARKRRLEIDAALARLKVFLNGGKGVVYDTDYDFGSLRAVIGSTGTAFKELVEGAAWQTVITYFDERPRFEPFHEIISNFRVQDVAVEGPGPNAPLICIVDSGVTPGNPFLKPVVHEPSLKSYVPGKLDNPYDESGHGSGVASLAAYYALNLDKGAANRAKLMITSARILNKENQLDPDVPDDGTEPAVQDAKLLSTLLKRVVEDFTRYEVRIFVLPFYFFTRLWNEEGRKSVARSSWVARTIDKLVYERDVLFDALRCRKKVKRPL